MVESNAFKEYQNKLLRRYDKKHWKIRNSWGSKHTHRSVNKNHILKSVDECTFLAIVRNIHKSLAEELAKGTPICLPYLGTFYIVNKRTVTYKKDNKIKTTKMIDWKATHQLWFTDKEAESEKILLRKNNSSYYHITWERGAFNNCSAFRFRACRDLKAKLKSNIRNDINILTYGK